MVIFRGEHTEGVSQTSLRFIRRGTVKVHSSPTDFASDGVSCARKDKTDTKATPSPSPTDETEKEGQPSSGGETSSA